MEGMHGWAKVVFHGSKRTKATIEALMKALASSLILPSLNGVRNFKQHYCLAIKTPHIKYEKHGNTYERTEPWEGLVSKINAWSNDASWLREKGTCPLAKELDIANEILHVRLAGRNIAETCQDTIQKHPIFGKTDLVCTRT